MKHIFVFLLAFFLISGNLISQENGVYLQERKIAEEHKEYIKKNLLKKSNKKDADRLYPLEEKNVIVTDSMANQINIIYRKFEADKMKKKPDTKLSSSTIEEKDYKSPSRGKSKNLPSNIRMVAEFEETQAVMVAIQSFPYGLVNDQIVRLMTGVEFALLRNSFEDQTEEIYIKPGNAVYWPFFYRQSDNFNEVYVFEPYEIDWIPNLGMFEWGGPIDHNIGDLWGKLIYEIHKECDVWIRLTGKDDYEDYMFEYFAERGFDIDRTKCKTFSNGTEDAFWVRDWGPLGIHYDDENNQRKLGFMDPIYYTGRNFDDVFSRSVLDELNYEYWELDIQMEGGNIMNDGICFGTYGGNVMYAGNSANYGQYYWDETDQKWYLETRTPLTEAQVDARLKEHFGFEDIIVVENLQDGFTSHIDLWIKQFDAETFLISYLPEDLYGQLINYKTLQRNREKLSNLTTAYGNQYRFLNAPMPTTDNDDPLPHTNLNWNLRGYLNGLIVNNVYIYPSFSKPGDANWGTDSTNNEILKSLLPGYRLVPIDSRYLISFGGAIHCITMQIPKDPAETFRIIHSPIRGSVRNIGNFEFSAELISNTEANKLVLYWKKTSEMNWKTVEMTTDNNTNFNTVLNYGSFTTQDTVKYYIAAQKDDEILKYTPLTAPEGFYSFYFCEDGPTVNIDQLYGYNPNSSAIASIYPNPATDYINVIFENENNGKVIIDIINSTGQILSTPINKYFNKGVYTVDITELNLSQGMYFLKMTVGENTSVKSFVIK